jgi:Flp pilus assembly protein TadG
MMNTIIRLKKDSRGSMAVEFALVFPVLLLLLFSVIELGSAWYNRQLLVNASREGARMAALADGMGDNDVVAQVRSILNSSGFGGAANITSTGASGSPGTMVTVEITANLSLPVLGSLVPGINSSPEATASTTMRHE